MRTILAMILLTVSMNVLAETVCTSDCSKDGTICTSSCIEE